jgi:hypothetical protein
MFGADCRGNLGDSLGRGQGGDDLRLDRLRDRFHQRLRSSRGLIRACSDSLAGDGLAGGGGLACLRHDSWRVTSSGHSAIGEIVDEHRARSADADDHGKGGRHACNRPGYAGSRPDQVYRKNGFRRTAGVDPQGILHS